MAADNAFLEVVSHAPLVILSIIIIFYNDPYYLAVVIRVLILSITYHLCLSDAWCLTPNFEFLHVLDHFGVWSLILWGMFSPMGYKPRLFIPFFLNAETLLILFAWLLPISIVMPLTLVFVYVSFTIIRFALNIPLKPLCPILFTVGTALIIAGAWFQYSVSSIHDPDYPWKHPIWHFLVMTGAICVYLASKTNLARKLHLDGYYRQLVAVWAVHYNKKKLRRH